MNYRFRTFSGYNVSNTLIGNYISTLINQFFKILPIKESGEPSLQEYMLSLQIEMLGCKGLIDGIGEEPDYIALLSILQYMIDNECTTKTVKREVFKAISVCKRLQKKFEHKEDC